MVSLSPVDQSVFCKIDSAVIFPVQGKWELKGATFFDLKAVRKSVLKDALDFAWQKITPEGKVKNTNGRTLKKNSNFQ